MGFYAPAQVVRDAREHGVEIRPVCVNRITLGLHAGARGTTGGRGWRCGSVFRMVKGLREDEAAKHRRGSRTEATRSTAASRRSGVGRTGASVSALERLAEADAFLPGLKLSRRDALWAIKPLRDSALPLVRGGRRARRRALA